MVSKLFKGFHDSFNGFSAVVTNKQFYIFKDKSVRFFNFQYFGNIEKQGTACVLKASHLSNDAKRLAWKTSEKNVMIGYAFRRNLSNVTMRHVAKIFKIDMLAIFINFASKYALGCQIAFSGSILDCVAKSADAGKEVNKSNGLCQCWV